MTRTREDGKEEVFSACINHFPINFKITKYDWRIYVKNRKENVKPQT